MLRNYLTIAIRNLLKHKVYTLTNIFGLAIGMTSVILITLFIRHELSYDRHHEKANRIYHILRTLETQTGEPATSPTTSGALAPALHNDLPEIQDVVRTFPLVRGSLVKRNDTILNQEITFAESSIFSIFTIPFIKGDPQTALQNSNSIVITESMAQRFFGQEDPMDKPIRVLDNFLQGNYIVTGIIKDFPKTSTFFFDGLTATLPNHMQDDFVEWNPTGTYRPFHTYILLPENYNVEQLKPKLQDLMARYMGEDIRATNAYLLQSLTRRHLYSAQDWGRRLDGYGDITHVYMFSIVGTFVLFIACINFMNLSTARSTNRAREVGLRKVVGAYRHQLIQQFLSESFLLTFIALCLAITLSLLFLPSFNQFMGKDLTLNITHLPVLLSLLGLTVIVGILAGSYPAFYLSAFRPVTVLKGTVESKKSRLKLRSGLVIFQFAISIILIVGTLTVYKQLNYIRNKNLGFDTTNVIGLNLFWKGPQYKQRYDAIKQTFMQHPNIHEATVTRFGQGSYITMGTYTAEGQTQTYQMGVFDVDENYLDFFNIPLITGRNFRFDDRRFTYHHERKVPVDGPKVMLNETAAKQLGWEDPIGKKFGDARFRPLGTIVGIMKDIHVWPLHRKIEPVVFTMNPYTAKQLYLKVGNQDIPGTLDFIETKWKEFLPDQPFGFWFLDHFLTQEKYQNEIRLGKVFVALAILAIFIASLGLLSLIAFMAEKRNREIGIRKVLGASTQSIIHLLTKDFLWLVLIANIIAWPIAYYALNGWLQNFAYRTNLNITTFILSGFFALIIALGTISLQAAKAARTNPVDTLKQE